MARNKNAQKSNKYAETEQMSEVWVYVSAAHFTFSRNNKAAKMTQSERQHKPTTKKCKL